MTTPVAKEWIQPGEKASLGQIKIGNFQERILIPTEYWSPADYRQQWIEAVDQISKTGDATALITEMYDPSDANFIKCWPIYKEGNTIHIQNRILFLDQLPDQFDLRKLGAYIK